MRWLKSLFAPKPPRPPYVGAIHGHRFVVVRRPLDTIEYGGHSGAQARQAFDAVWPNKGESVELWDYEDCRGRK